MADVEFYRCDLCGNMYSLRRQFDRHTNIEVLHYREAVEVLGSSKVEGLLVKNLKTRETETIAVDGIFVAIGMRLWIFRPRRMPMWSTPAR